MNTAKTGARMSLTVSTWGNSLAVRLPADALRQLGAGEGDTLICEISTDGRLILSAVGRAVGKAAVGRMRKFIGKQKVSAPVVPDMRRGARY